MKPVPGALTSLQAGCVPAPSRVAHGAGEQPLMSEQPLGPIPLPCIPFGQEPHEKPVEGACGKEETEC